MMNFINFLQLTQNDFILGVIIKNLSNIELYIFYKSSICQDKY